MAEKPDDYMEKCPYCHDFLLPIQRKDHFCNAPLLDVKEIPVIFSYITTEENGDKVVIARGYDGILYRLVRCDNPLNRRNVTGSGTVGEVPVPTVALCETDPPTGFCNKPLLGSNMKAGTMRSEKPKAL